ncbi:hypothetical protein F5B20DRAFT_501266 [Whalleya microplaca]|nr:hypothetical protein F5B20DRAFT_501266 [Whalleya microplaca]
MSTIGTPSQAAHAQAKTQMPSPSFESYHIRNSNINEGSGVKLSPQQRLLVGSVLDLFEGNPTLKHLSLWSRTGVFLDPITAAEGYDKFAAQWYGLPAVFNPIQIQRHMVTSAGNPITLELTNKYTLKGIKREQVINSVVRIHVGQDGNIDKVEDRWNDKLPEGSISEAFRKLNAVTVPTIVKVPKSEEEDAKMKAARDNSN